MNVNDLEALLNWLDRIGALDSANKDLIEDALWALKEAGNEYCAADSLKALERNFRNAGNKDAAEAVARLL